MIKIENLTKAYGTNVVLSNTYIDFPNEGIIGVIGHNGAGKSTLFRCICQLENYKGTIAHNLKSKVKNHIGYLPTSPYFFPKLTGREYLAFFQAMSNQSDNSNIKEWNSLFQLPLDKYIEKYSTGMKKKISFFGILLQKKDVYILDEPFNGLDMDAVLLFKKILLELKQKGRLVIISSHIISSLTDICDNIHYLNGGVFEKSYNPESYLDIEKSLFQKLDENISKMNL